MAILAAGKRLGSPRLTEVPLSAKGHVSTMRPPYAEILDLDQILKLFRRPDPDQTLGAAKDQSNQNRPGTVLPMPPGRGDRGLAARPLMEFQSINSAKEQKMANKQTKAEAAHAHPSRKSAARGRAALPEGADAFSGEHGGQAVKAGIIERLSELNSVEADIATLVRKSVSDSLRTGGAAAGQLVDVVHDVVIGAIQASEEVGVGLTMSTRSVAKGIVMGVHDVNGDIVTASSETLRSIIRHAATIGVDVGMLSRHAVDGVIEATAEIGGDMSQVARQAIEGAIEEAGKISNLTVRVVKEVLIGVAGGFGETIGAALPHGAMHGMEGTEKHTRATRH
jgi:hypothetical protein